MFLYNEGFVTKEAVLVSTGFSVYECVYEQCFNLVLKYTFN